ncbi:MAG TPA: DUF4129 domain-containing protein [Thermoplasmata archaeon]|nr:DUF4129 domain-containing protein [Thermoplasmata archaeon]
MAGGRGKRRPPDPRPIAAVLLASFLFAVAAISLSGVASPVLPSTDRPTLAGPVSLQEVGLVALALLGALLIYQVRSRVRGGTLPVPTASVVAIALILLMIVGWLALFHLVGGPGTGGVPTRPGSGPPGSNDSSGGSAAAGSSPLNGTNQSSSGPLGGAWAPFGWPWWVIDALVGLGIGGAAVAAVVTLAAVAPGLGVTVEPSAPRPDPRGSIALALGSLAEETAPDPRAAILRTYGRLLEELDPRLPGLAPMTAREIEEELVSNWQVGRSNAHALTALFETARYSTRPMTSEDGEAARRALEGALADVSGRSAPGR